MPEDEGLQPLGDFVAKYIDSVVQLEVLLVLVRAGDRPATPDAIARELRIAPEWVSDQLQRLCRDGLAVHSAEDGSAYVYRPRTQALRTAVAELEAAYQDRRVSVISMIYSKPPAPTKPASDPLKSFSDAFRLRKDRPNG